MLRILQPSDTSVEPTPDFATDAEIELAERLRHQLEERYLGPSAPPSSGHKRPGDDH